MKSNAPAVDELQHQLTDLKAEIIELSGTISKQVADVTGRTQPTIYEAVRRIRGAARAGLPQGRAILDTVKDNPGTASSIAMAAGIFGLAVGYFLGLRHQSTSLLGWRRKV